MSELVPEDNILLQRNEQLRSEIRLKIAARYRLLQMGITIILVGIGTIWTTQAFEVAFVGCVFVLVITYFLYAESRMISEIVVYLLQIEEVLDKKYGIPIPGWERHLLEVRHKRHRMQRIQIWSGVLFLLFTYSIFNAMGCLALSGVLRYIVGILVEFPVIAMVPIAFRSAHYFYRVE